jgi:hypothetical protein
VCLEQLDGAWAQGDASDFSRLGPFHLNAAGDRHHRTAKNEIALHEIDVLRVEAGHFAAAIACPRHDGHERPQPGCLAKSLSRTMRTSVEDGSSISFAPKGGNSIPSVAMIDV